MAKPEREAVRAHGVRECVWGRAFAPTTRAGTMAALLGGMAWAVIHPLQF